MKLTKFNVMFFVFIIIEAIGIIGGLYMPVGYGIIICQFGWLFFCCYAFKSDFVNILKFLSKNKS